MLCWCGGAITIAVQYFEVCYVCCGGVEVWDCSSYMLYWCAVCDYFVCSNGDYISCCCKVTAVAVLCIVVVCRMFSISVAVCCSSVCCVLV
jgi:hypothetical protein